MRKIIPCPPVNNKDFYKVFLQIHSIAAPIKKLRPKEKELLVELMYLHYIHNNLTPDVKKMVLESADVIKNLSKALNMSLDGVYNNLSILRGHGIIQKGTKTILNDKWIVYPDTENEIIFKIRVNESNTEKVDNS